MEHEAGADRPEGADKPEKDKSRKKKEKVRSAWIAFAGRIVAQLMGAAATVALGVMVLQRYAGIPTAGAPAHAGVPTAARPDVQIVVISPDMFGTLPGCAPVMQDGLGDRIRDRSAWRTSVVDKDAFAERGRTLEEDYFRRKEKEVIEKLRRKATADEEKRKLGERAGVADEEVLSDLQALGYTPETVMLLHLVPLIQTAWAEGGVSAKERDLIVKAARSRGIEAGTAADKQLGTWLSERPSEALFEKTLRAIRAILEAQPADARTAGEHDLLSLATAIASASGGIVGFGAVSAEERQILAHISEELEKGRKA